MTVAIVYVHGFSASKAEVRPLPDRVAAALHANLFFTRLTGHGQDGTAMAKGSINAWVNNHAEAIAIDRAIGERVVVIGTSTPSAAPRGRIVCGLPKGLNGYNIATSVFGRPEDFDPQIDPLVRMEARTVRRALEGSTSSKRDRPNAVRIEIPKGGYAPGVPKAEFGPPVAAFTGAGQSSVGHGRAFRCGGRSVAASKSQSRLQQARCNRIARTRPDRDVPGGNVARS
jgi:hypothetical protein